MSDYYFGDEDETSLKTLIDDRLRMAKDNMIVDAQTWDLCRRFLRGIHYLRDEPSLSYNRNEGMGPGMIRLTINLLLPIYNRISANLSVVTPSISARPASTVKADLVKAKTDAALAQYIWEKAKVPDVYRQAFEWLITCGTVGIHTFYDPDKKDIAVEAVAPYDMFVEPNVDDIDQSEYLFRRVYIAPHALRRAYPDVDMEKVNIVELKNVQSVVSQYNISITNPPRHNERVEVLEYWDKDGRHRIYSGTEILFDNNGDKKEYDPAKGYPIRAIRFHKLPGRFWGMGALEPLISPQREYNAQRSAIISNIRLMGNLQWLVPVNAGVDKITNRPGGVIRYNPAAPAPKQAGLSPLPNYVMDNVNRTHSEMLDMAGVHGASLGKRVAGIESGAAVNALVDQDVAQLQNVLDGIERSAVETAKQILSLAKTHFSESRMVRIFKQDGGMFYRMIKNTDLSDEPDIFIEAGSLFASKIKDRERRAAEMLQLGLLDPMEARRAINFNGVEDQMFRTIRNYNMALETLEAAVAGDQITILPTDPVDEMREVFEDFMHSEEFLDMTNEARDYVTSIFVSIIAQGNPQAAQALQTPLYPVAQPEADPNSPLGVTPGPPDVGGGGTVEGAAQRAENQEQAATYESFDPRANTGV
tara:strand:- start:8269 stop:10200 length:1932 start_codon:yes stop_codon:yes gene_type:complete